MEMSAGHQGNGAGSHVSRSVSVSAGSGAVSDGTSKARIGIMIVGTALVFRLSKVKVFWCLNVLPLPVFS
jgi:vacuolar-type H+-ATPase catalytic subunit A/Vma1